MSDILLRELTIADEPFLWEMLYQALYVAPGSRPFPRGIVEDPQISRYVTGWGRPGDVGVVAVDVDKQLSIGAVWLRLLAKAAPGYGYLDDETPELSIAVLPEYRGRGIGTSLLQRLMRGIEKTYKAISLSVSSENPAVRLYRRLGFDVVHARGESLIMVRRNHNEVTPWIDQS